MSVVARARRPDWPPCRKPLNGVVRRDGVSTVGRGSGYISGGDSGRYDVVARSGVEGNGLVK